MLVVHSTLVAEPGPRVALRQLDALRPDGEVEQLAAEVLLDGEALTVGEARRTIAVLALAVLLATDGARGCTA